VKRCFGNVVSSTRSNIEGCLMWKRLLVHFFFHVSCVSGLALATSRMDLVWRSSSYAIYDVAWDASKKQFLLVASGLKKDARPGLGAVTRQYVYRIVGEDVVRCIGSEVRFDLGIDIDLQGTKIVFTRANSAFSDGGRSDEEVLRISELNGDRHIDVSVGLRGWPARPAWDDTGHRLAYELLPRLTGSDREIWYYDSTDSRQVLIARGEVSQPGWTDNGKNLAFMVSRDHRLFLSFAALEQGSISWNEGEERRLGEWSGEVREAQLQLSGFVGPCEWSDSGTHLCCPYEKRGISGVAVVGQDGSLINVVATAEEGYIRQVTWCGEDDIAFIWERSSAIPLAKGTRYYEVYRVRNACGSQTWAMCNDLTAHNFTSEVFLLAKAHFANTLLAFVLLLIFLVVVSLLIRYRFFPRAVPVHDLGEQENDR